MMDDPDFESAPGREKYGLTSDSGDGGRYRFPPPPGEPGLKGGGAPTYMRMTNLVSAFSDQKALQEWMEWQAMEGLRLHDGVLMDEWAVTPLDHLDNAGRRAAAVALGTRARQANGADSAARRGTARHDMMHGYFTEGRRLGTRSMLKQLDSALEALDAHGFDVVRTEYMVWHPAAGGTMGTSDVEVMERSTGHLGTFDWKTQARFWTWQEIAGQLFGYDSAPWRWEGPRDDTGGWVATEPHTLLGTSRELLGQRVTLVAHMPQAPGPGQLPVEIHEVSVDYGQAVLRTAARNVHLRSVGRSRALGRRPANPRPIPG